MELKDLKNYGLFKSLDLEKDQRINVFCKAGGGFIYFTMIVIGYFLSNKSLFFDFKNFTLLFIQFTLVIILYILYILLHEVVHYIASKIVKVKSKWNVDGIIPYVSLENEIIKNSKYYFIIFAPIVVFTIILIPIQIIVSIYAYDWFWLVWLSIIQNFSSSIGDLVAFFLTRKFKNAYIEDLNYKISIYIPESEFEYYKLLEKNHYEKIAKKHAKKRKLKKMIKDIPNEARNKVNNDLNNLEDEDTNDLNKLDM